MDLMVHDYPMQTTYMLNLFSFAMFFLTNDNLFCKVLKFLILMQRSYCGLKILYSIYVTKKMCLNEELLAMDFLLSQLCTVLIVMRMSINIFISM